MRIRLRAFGITLVSLTIDTGPLLEIIEECVSEVCDDDRPQISGGSGGQFERDQYPPDGLDPDGEQWDSFGFTAHPKR